MPKGINRFKKTLRRDRKKHGILLVTALLFAAGITQPRPEPFHVDPAAYDILLDTIAKGESRGNYNAYFGKPNNKAIRFTQMPVGEVLAWQEDFVRKGSVSSAVGKYQFIRPTLAGLVEQLKINPRTRFDEILQDRLAITLLERRGAHAFVQKKLSREQFAANLAREWAALPKATGSNPHESYYAKDGINKSRVRLDEVYKALAAVQAQATI